MGEEIKSWEVSELTRVIWLLSGILLASQKWSAGDHLSSLLRPGLHSRRVYRSVVTHTCNPSTRETEAEGETLRSFLAILGRGKRSAWARNPVSKKRGAEMYLLQ